jgi:hypothetical protein
MKVGAVMVPTLFFDLRFTNLFVGKERRTDGLTDFIHNLG